MKSILSFAALVFLTFTLNGCNSKKEEGPPCPPYAIIGDFAQLSLLKKQAVDPNDIKAIIKINKIQAYCTGDVGQETVNFSITLMIKPLQSLKEPLKIHYFIAVVNKSNEILDQQEFTAIAKLEGETAPITIDENFSYSLKPREEKLAKDYRLLIGLVLTPEQLAMQKQQKAALEKQLLSIQTPQEVTALKKQPQP